MAETRGRRGARAARTRATTNAARAGTQGAADELRLAVFQTLSRVIGKHESAAVALPDAVRALSEREAAWVRALVLTVMRWLPRLEAAIDRLLDRPLKTRDQPARLVLLQGLAELLHFRTPDHAAVRENVALCRSVGMPHLAGLVNAVLRRSQREREAFEAGLDANPATRHALPDWLLAALQHDWPQDWEQIADRALAEAPMTLRVNRARLDRDAALERLRNGGLAATAHPLVADALMLDVPVPVAQIPGFYDGDFSVQDAAAQWAARLLAPQPGHRVLDACSAPGGKAGHLLEMMSMGGVDGPPPVLVAVDFDATRMERVADNLARLGMQAVLEVRDLRDVTASPNVERFDRILLDAPCSATGVLRRHPDIKWLRRPSDIAALAADQRLLLERCWNLLRPGGRLLYATCSLLDAENTDVCAGWLAATPDAQEIELAFAGGVSRPVGRAIPLGCEGMDGFYYALFEKRATGGGV